MPFYEKGPERHRRPGLLRTAATYSPNWWVSTIGDGEFNVSVRNGKRWDLTAIATAVYRLREKPLRFATIILDPLQGFAYCCFTFPGNFRLGKSFGPLVQVG